MKFSVYFSPCEFWLFFLFGQDTSFQAHVVSTYLPKPDDHVMFITVLPSVIRVSTPIIDVNFSQTTHEKLNEKKTVIIHFNQVNIFFNIRYISHFCGNMGSIVKAMLHKASFLASCNATNILPVAQIFSCVS